jgi:hypothetical protein
MGDTRQVAEAIGALLAEHVGRLDEAVDGGAVARLVELLA